MCHGRTLVGWTMLKESYRRCVFVHFKDLLVKNVLYTQPFNIICSYFGRSYAFWYFVSFADCPEF